MDKTGILAFRSHDQDCLKKLSLLALMGLAALQLKMFEYVWKYKSSWPWRKANQMTLTSTHTHSRAHLANYLLTDFNRCYKI